MLAVRHRRAGPQQRQLVVNDVTQFSIQDLRQQCLDKCLSHNGRPNSLIARLQRHASTNNNANKAPIRPALSNVQLLEVEHEMPNQSNAVLLNSAQLARVGYDIKKNPKKLNQFHFTP